MLWALIRSDGKFMLRFDDPAQEAEEDEGVVAVVAIPREPDTEYGEGVDSNGIHFDFDLVAASVTAAIKREAERRIYAVAPIWRQLNDAHEPNGPGAAERRSGIRNARDWSNDLEGRCRQCGSAADLRSLLETEKVPR